SWQILAPPHAGTGWSAQIAAEALDSTAGLLEVLGLRRIGNAERRPGSERGTLDHRDALGLQELGDEVLVGLQLLARRRGTADRPRARGIDVERAVRLRTADAARLVQHGDHEIAALLEHLVVLRNEMLRAVERLDRGPLRDRARIGRRLRLQGRH